MQFAIGGPAGVLAAATTVGLMGGLLAAPVHARPPLPLAPSAVCSFARDTLVVNRKDGQMVTPDTQAGGTAIGPRATLFNSQRGPFSELDKTSGGASGGMKDYHISFTFTPPGRSEQYEGEVTSTGAVTGWIQGGGSGSWSAPDGSVTCSSSTNGGTATVTDDVDVYSKPSGNDADKYPAGAGFPGFLAKGTQVNLVKGGGCPSDDWCQITGSNVPTGNGWAWGAFFK